MQERAVGEEVVEPEFTGDQGGLATDEDGSERRAENDTRAGREDVQDGGGQG